MSGSTVQNIDGWCALSVHVQCRPSGVEFMMDVIPSLPIPSSSLIQTYLSLLLHTELALLLSSTHNVISFYPSWVRMVIKKGLLSRQDGKDDGSRQHTPVATQLQQKRVKVYISYYSSVITIVVVNSGRTVRWLQVYCVHEYLLVAVRKHLA